MTNNPPNVLKPLLIVTVLAIPILFFIAQNPSWQTLLQIAFLVILVPLFLISVEMGFLALIVLRPAMDLFSQVEFLKLGNFSLNLSSTVSILAIAWIAYIILKNRQQVWRRPLFYPILVFFVISLASIFYTYDFANTLTEIVRSASIFFVYLLASMVINSLERFKRFLKAVGFSLVAPVFFAIVQLISQTGLSFAGVNNRLYGTFGHPNALAFYMVLTIGIFITYFFSLPLEKRNKSILAIPAILFFILLLTYTRGAWLGLGAFLILIGFFHYRKAIIALIVVAVLAIGLAPTVNNFLFDEFNINLSNVPVIQRITDESSEESSIEWRLEVWSDMRRRIVEQPYFGYGLGSFPVLREQSVKGFFESTDAHNDYLRYIIELGFVGLLAYCFLIFKNIGNLFYRYIKSQTRETKAWLLGGCTLAVSFAIMSFYDNIMQGTAVMWLFWSLMAVVYNYSKFMQKNS